MQTSNLSHHLRTVRLATTLLSLSQVSLPSAKADDTPIAPPVVESIIKTPGRAELTIRNPPRVKSYRIEVTEDLGGPFRLAQENFPVSATSTTVWTDNTASVPRRFYRVANDRIENLNPLADRTNLDLANGTSYFNFEHKNNPIYLSNEGDTDLHWKFVSSSHWLTAVQSEGLIPCRANVKPGDPYYLSREWKTFNKNWDFKGITGIGVRNTDSRVFLLDSMAGIIRIHDLNGNLLHGINYPSLSGSSHIAFDASGNFYISDSAGVGVFNSAGTYLRRIGQGICSNAFDLAIDTQGQVYITDGGSLKVHKFDSTGQHLLSWQSGFTHPANTAGMGIVLDSQGKVYVADDHYRRIQKFNGQGVLLATWGSLSGSTDWQAGEIFCIDNLDRIYVAHEHSSSITRLNTDLTQTGSLNPNYSLWGHQYMRDASVSSAGVMYSIAENGVYGFNSSGAVSAWQNRTNTDLAFYSKEAFRINAEGNLYFTGDLSNGQMIARKFDPKGNLLTQINRLSSSSSEVMAIDSQNRVYFIDPAGISVYDKNLLFLKTIPRTNVPYTMIAGMQVDAQGLISIIPDYNDAVRDTVLVKINQNGALLDQWALPPQMISSNTGLIAQDSKGITYLLGLSANTFRPTVFKFNSSGALLGIIEPNNMPYQFSMAIDSKDNLFTATAAGFEKYSAEAELISETGFTPSASSAFGTRDVYLQIAPNGDVFCFSDRPGQIEVYSQVAGPIFGSVNHSQLPDGISTGSFQIIDSDNTGLTPLTISVTAQSTKSIP